MAIKGKNSPTVLDRWFEGQWKPFAIKALSWVGLFLFCSPVLVPVLIKVNDLPPGLGDFFTDPEDRSANRWNLSIWACIVFGFWVWVCSKAFRGDTFKELVVRSFGSVASHDRMAAMGKGGSAAFAGLLDEWAHPYKKGSVRLGRSLYDGAMIGFEDDRGLLTIASNRSGKGRSAIIPNLLLWPGSAVVIDPKGTNAAVTAARRGKGGGRVSDFLGHDVHVVDPFGITPGITSAIFNPLDSLDLTAITAKEDVDLLADALVVSTGAEDSHWNESAQQILAGLIAHLKSQETNLPATLVDVRQALLGDIDELDALFGAMQQNPVAGGAARAAASLVANASDKERGSMMTTALRNTSWLDSMAMARVMTTTKPNLHNGKLRTSDFSMADMKTRPMTIYVVLPPDLLDVHSRFMRLFVNLTVRAAARGGKSKIPILLIMDEFYSLGPLATLAKASGALAGYGLKLWPILQNLSQLRQLYPQNWQTFFANAGAVQIFGVNDRETAHEIVERLGRSRWSEKIDDKTVAVVTNLIEAHELEELTDRSTGLQLVMRSGRSSLLLEKTPYDLDPLFNKAMYSPDPDHTNS